jgi:hypothetical protein
MFMFMILIVIRDKRLKSRNLMFTGEFNLAQPNHKPNTIYNFYDSYNRFV